MVDAEADEDAPQRPRLRCLDPVDEKLRRPFPDAIEGDERIDREVVDVGGVFEQLRRRRTGGRAPRRALRCRARPGRPSARAAAPAVRGSRRSRSGDWPRPRPARAARRTRGTSSGTSNGLVFGGRLATTGPTTSGMTSPARRTTTVSPGRTSLRSTSSSLCSVAMPTLAPPTNTGSSTANGVARPVRPMLTMMSRRIVVFSSGGNLYAIAQRGARDVKPISSRCASDRRPSPRRRRCRSRASDGFASISSQNAYTASSESNCLMFGLTGNPSSVSHCKRLLVRPQHAARPPARRGGSRRS